MKKLFGTFVLVFVHLYLFFEIRSWFIVNLNKAEAGQCPYKKKIKKRFLIFWEVGEVRGVSIFCLGTVGEVVLDSGWFGAGYKTHRVPSYDLDTPSDALDNQIGPSVWPLWCFEVIKPEPQKTEIWEIPVFSIGTFIIG